MDKDLKIILDNQEKKLNQILRCLECIKELTLISNDIRTQSGEQLISCCDSCSDFNACN